mgnify:CR=1 FL=1
MVDSIYGPAAFIQDASVFVSDDLGNSYEFTFIDKITWVDTIVIDTTFIFYGTPVPFDTTIFDTNIQVLEELGNRFELANKARSFEEILDDKSIDAVLIASPTDTHLELIIKSANSSIIKII